MTISLGDLLLQLRIDPSAYNQQLEKARMDALQVGAQIEQSLSRSISTKTDTRSINSIHKDLDLVSKHWVQVGNLMQSKPLTPKVDDRELTELNKHLDKKQKHWIETWDLMDSNPLTPKVDDRQLTDLNQTLSTLEKAYTATAQTIAKTPITPTVDTSSITQAQIKIAEFRAELTSLRSESAVAIQLEAQHKVDTSNLDRSFDRAGNILEKKGEKVGESIAHKVSKTSVTTRTPGGLLGGIIGSTAQGVLFSVGGKIAAGTSQALDRTLNQFGANLERTVTSKLGKQVALLAKDLGYRNTREFRRDVGRLGGVVDEFIDPVKARRGAQRIEGAASQAAQDYFVNGKSLREVGRGFIQEVAPPNEAFKEAGLKAGGAALRAVSPVLRINKDVQLARLAKEAAKLAEEVKITDEYVAAVRQHNAAVFAIGGMHHMEGRGGQEIVKPMLERVMPGAYVEGVSNKYRDSDKVAPQGINNALGRIKPGLTIEQLLKQTGLDRTVPPEILKLLDTAAFSGATPEIVQAVAKAKALRDRGVDTPIAAVGYSAGGADAADFARLAAMLGIDAKAVGIGSPVAGIANRRDRNFQAVLGTNDHIYRGIFGSAQEQQAMLQRASGEEAQSLKDMIQAGYVLGSPISGANVIQGAGQAHKLSDYIAHPLVQQLLEASAPGTVAPYGNAFTNQQRGNRMNVAGSRGLDFVDQLEAKKPDRALQKIEEGLTTPSANVRQKRIEELRNSADEYRSLAKKSQGTVAEQIKALVAVFDAGIEALEQLEDSGGMPTAEYRRAKVDLQSKAGRYYDLADNARQREQAQFFDQYDRGKYQAQFNSGAATATDALKSAQDKAKSLASANPNSYEAMQLLAQVNRRSDQIQALEKTVRDPKASARQIKDAALQIEEQLQGLQSLSDALNQADQQIKAKAKYLQRPKRLENRIENPWDSEILPEGTIADYVTERNSQTTGKKAIEIDDPWKSKEEIRQERIQRRLNKAKQRVNQAAQGAKTAAGQARDFIFDPNREITIDMDRLQDFAEKTGAVVYQSGLATAKALDATAGAFRAIAGSDAGQALIGGMGNAAKAIGGVAKAGYALAAGMEAVALDLVPGGRMIKGALKQTAVPALAFGAATHFLPGGAAIGHGIESLTSGALTPLFHGGADLAGSQAAGLVHQVVPNVLGLQAKMAGAAAGLIEGSINAAIGPAVQAVAAIGGGKVLTTVAERTVGGVMGGIEALPGKTAPALPPSQNLALPAAGGSILGIPQIGSASPAAAMREMQDLTRKQLAAIAKQYGLNARGNKNELIQRLEQGLGYSKLDPILSNLDQMMDRKGQPIGGYNFANEKAMLAQFKASESAINQKIREIRKSTGEQRQQLLESLYADAHNFIVQLEDTKKSLLSGKTTQTIGQMQGRIEGTFRHTPEVNEARTQRIQAARDAAGTQTIDVNPTRLARVAAPNLMQRMLGLFQRPQQIAELSQTAQSTFETFYQSAAKVAKVDATKFAMPKVRVDNKLLDRLGQDAFYDIQQNLILVRSDVAGALDKGALAIKSQRKKLAALTHELAHAFQTEGGSLSVETAAARNDYQFRTAKLDPRAQMQVNASIEAAKKSNPNVNIEAVERLERDAYLFEQKTNQIASRVQRSAMVQQGRDRLGEVRNSLPNLIQGGVDFVKDAPQNLTKLAKSATLAVTGLAGMAGVSFVTGLLSSIAGNASEAALEMERFSRVINFTSAGKGAENIAQLKAEANRLGLDQRASIAGYAQFSASTKETPLEGDQTMRIFNSVSAASANYALTPERQKLVFEALSQMASKGVVSMEELRGQLGESLPGALNIAARAMGMTTGEFTKLVASGEVLASDFLPKFAQQLGAESQSGVAASANSAQASINKLNNKINDLQVAIGQGLLTGQKIGADAAVGGINLLTGAMSLLLKILPAVSLMFAGKFVGGLAGLKAMLPLIQSGLGALMNTLSAMLPTIATFVAKFLIVQTIVDVLGMVGKALSDQGGKFREFANTAKESLTQYRLALQDARKSQEGFILSMPQTSRDLKGDSLAQDTLIGQIAGFIGGATGKELVGNAERGIQKALGLSTFAEKQATDRTISMNELLGSRDDTSYNITEQIKRASSELNRMKEIDRQLEAVQARRRALATTNPNDKAGIRDLKTQEDALVAQRETLSKPIALLQQANAGEIETYKNSIKELNQLAATGKITQSEYTQKLGQFQAALQGAQQDQDRLNQAVKISVTTLEMFERAWGKIVDRLEDAQTALKKQGDATRKTIAQAELAGATQGSSQFKTELMQQDQLREKLKLTQNAIAQMRSELSTQNVDVVKQNFGITDQTGAAEIKSLSERATGPKEKAILAKLSDLTKLESDINDMEADLAEAQVAAKRRLIDLTKQVSDFYRTIQRQAEDAALGAKDTQNQIGVINAKMRLKQALTGFQDNYISEFADNLINLVEQLNEPFKQAIEAQKQILGKKNQLEDSLKQASELGKQLPTGYDGMAADGISSSAPSLSNTNFAGKVVMERTGKKDQYGLEDLKLIVFDRSGKAVSEHIVQSGQARTQNQFGRGGTTRAGSMAPVEYGTYNIEAPVASGLPGVGKTFIGTTPTFNTERSAIGFHADANRATSPGSAGCIVFKTEADFNRFQEVLKLSGAKQFQFLEGNKLTQQLMQSGRAPSTGGFRSLPAASGAMDKRAIDALFVGGSNSPIAKIIGMAEGNRTASGGYTKNAYGHVDPGNSAYNIGSFSAQGSLNKGSIAASDQAVIEQLIKPSVAKLHRQAQAQGVSVTPKLLLNFLDTINQGGEAVGTGWSDRKSTGVGFLGKLGMIRGRENDDAAIRELRMESYRNTRGSMEVASIFRDRSNFSADQQRRMNEINKAMGAFRNLLPTSGGSKVPVATMMPTTGLTQGEVESREESARQYNESQSQLTQAQSEAVTATNQQIEQIKRMAEVQGQSSRLDAELAMRKAGRQLKVAGREQSRSTRGLTEQFQDMQAQIGESTPNKQFQQDLKQADREYQKFRESIQDNAEKINNALTEATNIRDAIGSGALPEEFKRFLPELNTQIASLQKQQETLSKTEKELDTTFATRLEDIKQKFAIANQARQFQFEQELSGKQIEGLRSQATQLQSDSQRPGTLYTKRFDLQQQALNLGYQADVGDINAKLKQLNFTLDEQVRKGERTSEEAAKLRAEYEKLAQVDLGKLKTQLENQTAELEKQREQVRFDQFSRGFQSRMNLNNAYGNYAQTWGFETQAKEFQKKGAIAQENFNMLSGMREIDQWARDVGAAPEIVAQLKTNLQELNQVNLQNINAQFNPLTDALKSVKGAFQGFLGDMISGSTSVEDAFSKMVDGILQSLSAMAAQLITEQIFGSLFGLGKGGPGGLLGIGGGAGAGVGGLITGLLGFADGGVVPSKEQNLRDRPDAIGQALRKEGSNSVLATLTPGEMVLTTEQTRRYLGLGLHRFVEKPSTALARANKTEHFGRIHGFAAGGIVPGGAPIQIQPSSNIGATNINIPIDISGGQGQQPSINMPKLKDAVRASVIEELRRQKRGGGELA